MAAWKTRPQDGLPSSELTLTVPLVPGRRVLAVPLELNSMVRVAPGPQRLGETTASGSPPEQSGSNVTSLTFVPSGNSLGVGGVPGARAGEVSLASYAVFSLTRQ